jgi:hypothetical protein
MKLISAMWFVGILCAVPSWAVPVPTNGSFERSGQHDTEGWDVYGPWEFRGQQNHDGRRSAAIGNSALSGDRLVSHSGPVLRSGGSVTLTGYYHGNGLAATVEIVDQLGAVLDAASIELPPADNWTEFSVSYHANDDVPGKRFAYARARLEAISDEAQGVLDSIQFADPLSETPPQSPAKTSRQDENDKHQEPPIPPPPPNLVPNPQMLGTDSPRGWSSFGPGEQSGWRPGSTGVAGALTLQGGDAEAGWWANLNRMDISVPHRFSLRYGLGESDPTLPYATLLIFDPRYTRVYSHLIVPIVPGKSVITAVVPAMEKLPASGVGKLTVLVPAGFGSSLQISNPSLLAGPHEPSVNPRGALLGVFDKPSKTEFFCRISNRIEQITEMIVHLKVVNRDGVGVAYEKRKMAVAPHAAAFFPVRPKLNANGAYQLVINAQVADGSRSLTLTTSPFVVSPATPDEPKNRSIGVAISGYTRDEVEAAATAGAGWVAAPLQYNSQVEAYELRSRLRQLDTLKRIATGYGVRFALTIRFDGDDLPAEDHFAEFFGAVNSALGDNVGAYVLEMSPEQLAAEDSATHAATLALTMQQVCKAATVQTAPTIMTPFAYVMEEVAAKSSAATGDTPEPDVEAAVAPLSITATIMEQPADDDELRAKVVIMDAPFDDAPATEPPETTGIATPTEAPSHLVPRAVKSDPQAEPYPVYHVFMPADDDAGDWMLPVMTSPDEDKQPAGVPADALIVRQTLSGLAKGHHVAFWDGTRDGAILTADGSANACWAALWAMARQLCAKTFTATQETSERVVALRFNGEDEDTLVLWAMAGTEKVQVSGDLNDCRIVDIGGAQQQPEMTGPHLRITLTTAPVYLTIPAGSDLNVEVATVNTGGG